MDPRVSDHQTSSRSAHASLGSSDSAGSQTRRFPPVFTSQARCLGDLHTLIFPEHLSNTYHVADAEYYNTI
ncbi:hypothetical protein KUCAC02_024318 [Chaenocephalus aceratus]|uniref:Uncharacterized protein n=1 Tax=Chaenocephalus aceratus TaxID=36190 RepID=A0ACB9WI70_CHAAC|nr:hypothetical protein KUCAC02_024318 [Chaenocephalus aceratus]